MEHKNKKEEKSNSNRSQQKVQGAQNIKAGASKEKDSKQGNKSGNASQKRKRIKK